MQTIEKKRPEGQGMPALVAYGETETKDTFPLILIFGREFNNDEFVVEPYRTGPYCFSRGCCGSSTFL
jgi:hypothetical protein